MVSQLWVTRQPLFYKFTDTVWAAVPFLAEPVCKIDCVVTERGRFLLNLVNTKDEIELRRQSATTLAAINPVPIWHTDPVHVVKVFGVLMFFPKIRAHILREAFNN